MTRHPVRESHALGVKSSGMGVMERSSVRRLLPVECERL